MLLARLERGIIDRERAGLALADVPAQRCRLAPGHPVARTIALGIAERPQIECIDALIRRSAMTHRPPPCPVRPPGPRPWRDSLFELADDEVSDFRGDVAACAFWSGQDRKSDVEGKSGSVRVDLGGRPTIKQQTTI